MKNLLLCFLALVWFMPANAQIYTKGEVYDYDIGDEFHYRHSGGGMYLIPDSFNIIRVLNKYTTNSHLFYEYGNISRADSTLVLSTYWDSIAIADLNSLVIDTSSNWNPGDTIFKNSTTTIDTSYYYGQYTQALFFSWNYPDGYEPPAWFHSFVKGYGEVNYYMSRMNGFSSRSLVYVKKSNGRWGNRVYFTGTKKIKNELDIQTYPNPFHDKIQVDWNGQSSEAHFYLYNNLGLLIQEEALSPFSNYTTIEVNPNLPQGIYHAIITDKKKQVSLSLIKQ